MKKLCCIFWVILCIFMITSCAETREEQSTENINKGSEENVDEAEKESRLPKQVSIEKIDLIKTDSIFVVWSNGVFYEYTVTRENAPKTFAAISEKFPMSFSYVEDYEPGLTGEGASIEFRSDGKRICGITLDVSLFEPALIATHDHGVYRPDDPDWEFTGDELRKIMAPHESRETQMRYLAVPEIDIDILLL